MLIFFFIFFFLLRSAHIVEQKKKKNADIHMQYARAHEAKYFHFFFILQKTRRFHIFTLIRAMHALWTGDTERADLYIIQFFFWSVWMFSFFFRLCFFISSFRYFIWFFYFIHRQRDRSLYIRCISAVVFVAVVVVVFNWV